jgi:undecaprenyl-diphosphatase
MNCIFKNIVKIFIVIFSVLVLSLGTYFAYNLMISGNFHTVTLKQAYRSKQLNKNQFEYYIKKYGIKSILNLRGSEQGVEWYEDEMSISRTYNVKHYDLELPAMTEPDAKDIEEIIKILKLAPRPILIHCLGGADRSGLISAIWQIVINKKTKNIASKQLSFWYGHMPFGKARAMDRWLASHRIDSDSGKITRLK